MAPGHDTPPAVFHGGSAPGELEKFWSRCGSDVGDFKGLLYICGIVAKKIKGGGH